ncbi:hypothetical protein Hanom_Chr03g00192191 [Helianthus anomalus]
MTNSGDNVVAKSRCSFVFFFLQLLQYFPVKGFYECTKPADFKAFGDKTTKWI